MRRMQAVSFAVLFGILAGNSPAAVVENIRTSHSPEYTRLVFELDSSVEHKLFTLENPDRVVIDLAQSSLRSSIEETGAAATPIARIRSGVRNGHDLRVVLDLRHKVKPRSFLLQANAEHGNRLVIDLYSEGAASQQTGSARAAEESRREIVIAINAGHGGEDPGAIGVNRLQEKQVVMAIAREMERMINDLPGYRAVMIRERDHYIGLRQRVLKAHQAKADLYLAIHADAHKNSKAQGTTIYALSQSGATSEQARLLAEKENNADLIGGAGALDLSGKDELLASVLLDLSMTGTVSTSLEIGNTLIEALQPVVNMRRTNVEQAAFVELKSHGIPSLLIETGYITNAHDAKNLDSPTWRRNFAAAVVNGINEWFYERPPPGTWISWQKANGGLVPGSYTVRRGDTLSEIAERFNVSLALLKSSNALSGNTIRVGQTLKLPGAGPGAIPVYREHTISRGETLSHIAVNYSVSLDAIRAANALESDRIRVGQILKIPAT